MENTFEKLISCRVMKKILLSFRNKINNNTKTIEWLNGKIHGVG